MDPISAFGLASTILQFIDCGIKFAQVISNVYKGVNLRSESQESIVDLVKLTKAFIDVLYTFHSPPSNTSNCVAVKKDGLALLADECIEINETLLQRLRKLGFPDKPPSRKRDALKEAIKAKFSQQDIEAIRSRLNGFRDRFNFHLLVSLRQYATQSLTKQEETLEALNISSQNSKKLEVVTNSILNQLASKAMFQGENHWQTDLRAALVAQIYNDTETSTRHTATSINLAPENRIVMEKTIISTLKYRNMEDRQGRISSTYKTTFQWILSESKQSTQRWQKQSLREWLESDEQIYWISGKAGSGKSTLMKYLCQPTSEGDGVGVEAQHHTAQVTSQRSRTKPVSRCRPFLSRWAGEKEVVIASFYFWISDSGGLQKSYEGLLRSLLFQILVAKPEVIPEVLPSRWEALSIFGIHPELSSWTDSQLHHALELSVDAVTAHRKNKICFFIDGLDEFEGKSKDLVGLIQILAQKGSNTKFCVASRPWVVFQDAFETKPHLRLEDFNYVDIRYFVDSKLQEDTEFSKLCQREPDFANQLVENIVSKASGVFLWIHLVVASLLSGMSFGDRIEDLQRRLDLLPPDLENLYDRMLRDLDPFYLEHAAQLILLMEASNRALPLIVFSFADTESVESLKALPSLNMSSSAIDLRVDSMSRRLNSRWKGMLELNRKEQLSVDSGGAHRTVQYLHRTVKDFIQSDKVQQFLGSSIKSPFDPHLKLCIAWCAYLKTRPDSTTGFMTEPDAILQHAAQVMTTSEKEMLEVLDHLSEVVPATSQSRAYRRANQLGYTCEAIIYLSVTFSVFAYVKARVDPVQDESLCTELLMHAIKEPKQLNAPMIMMLLDMGADVTDMSGYSTWKTLLARVADTHRTPIKTLAALDDASRIAVVGMVANRAPVEEVRRHYVKAFKNRFGMREVISSSVFTDGFFDELKTVKVTRRSKSSRQIAKWFKSHGRS